MSCNKCKQNNCGCPVKDLYSNCVNLSLGELACSGILAEGTLDEFIVEWDRFLCDKIGSLANYIRLDNIGTGSEIYAGDTVLGVKKIRTLKSSDSSISLTQGTEEIDFILNHTPVTEGTGNPIYTGQNIAGDYKISSLKDLSIADVTSIYKGYSNGNHIFAGISSQSIAITEDAQGNIQIESAPETAYTAGVGLDLVGTEFSFDVAWGDNRYASNSSMGVKSMVFKRSVTQPATPTGGSYTDLVPTGWSDGVPPGTDPLYMSTRIFTPDGLPPQTPVWTTPNQMSDSVDINIEWSDILISPGNPTDDPTKWSDDPNTNAIWIAIRKKSNGAWGAWDISKIKGEQGDPGDAGTVVYKSIVFKKATSTPATPTGGSFASPIPVGWSDGVPAGTGALYMTTRLFTSDGQPPQQATWTDPKKASDSSDVDIEWSEEITTPGDPTSDPLKWSNAATVNTIWMAVRTAANGVWSAWDVSKIKGEDGSDGIGTFKSIIFKRGTTLPATPTGGSFSQPVPSGWSDGVPSGFENLYMSTRIFTTTGDTPQQAVWTAPKLAADSDKLDIEWSDVVVTPGNPTDNVANWDNTASVNTIWMAIRKKSAGVWGSWDISKIKGEQGDAGDAGKSSITIFMFQGADTPTPAPPVSVPGSGNSTYKFSTGEVIDPPTNWLREIDPNDGHKYIWMIQATATTTTDIATFDHWSTPAIIYEKGTDGQQGASLAYRGEWKSFSTYSGTPTLVDFVVYNNEGYIAKTDAGTIPAGTLPTDTSKWNGPIPHTEALYTDFMVAFGAYIQDLTVGTVRTGLPSTAVPDPLLGAERTSIGYKPEDIGSYVDPTKNWTKHGIRQYYPSGRIMSYQGFVKYFKMGTKDPIVDQWATIVWGKDGEPFFTLDSSTGDIIKNTVPAAPATWYPKDLINLNQSSAVLDEGAAKIIIEPFSYYDEYATGEGAMIFLDKNYTAYKYDPKDTGGGVAGYITQGYPSEGPLIPDGWYADAGTVGTAPYTDPTVPILILHIVGGQVVGDGNVDIAYPTQPIDQWTP